MRGVAVLVATAGGVGFLPFASGTAGSLVTLPLVMWLAHLRDGAPLAYAAIVVALIALAIWSAGRAAHAFDEHDSSRIVIDEVAGMVTTGAFLPGSWTAIALGFVFFRVFDVWKPYPAGYIDRDVGGGFGVVGDDLVAGVYAGVVTRVILNLTGVA